MEELGEEGGGSLEKDPGGGMGGKAHLEAKVCVFPVNEKESIVLFSN